MARADEWPALPKGTIQSPPPCYAPDLLIQAITEVTIYRSRNLQQLSTRRRHRPVRPSGMPLALWSAQPLT